MMLSRPDGPQTDAKEAQGFLYVEVLVGLMVLSLVLLSIVPLFILAARENTTASDLTFAMTAAQDKAEELKAEDYDTLAAGSDVLTLRTMSYDRTWTVTADSPHPGMTTVTVAVAPRRENGYGSTQSASVSFYRVEMSYP
jgi:type II secretory pathway pseudopilin PulG